MDHAELISKMTDEEKASLCSGADFWHTKGVARLGIPQMMLTDGPHGLRKQIAVLCDGTVVPCSRPRPRRQTAGTRP